MEVNYLLQSLQYKSEPDCCVFRSHVRNPANLNNSILGEALFVAVTRRFLNSVRILLEAGASPNTRGLRELTPLHICSGDKQGIEIVRELLKHGADVNAETRAKSTPLHRASMRQCVENMQELLKNGARVDAVDKYLYTPLLLCVEYFEDVSTVQVLLSAGADVNYRDKLGKAPLHHAVIQCLPQVVRILIQHKADVNVKDFRGETPLHHIAFASDRTFELIRELHKGGACLNEFVKNGYSHLYRAVSYANVEATQELLHRGALFDIVECLGILKLAAFNQSPRKITAIAHELIRYTFMNGSDSLETIRQKLMQARVVEILRKISSPECNLEKFKNACLSEVEALSKTSCDCGKSSVWGSFMDHEACDCDVNNAILKFLFSRQPSIFTDSFFYRVSKEFYLVVTLNLLACFECEESEKYLNLPWPCVKEIGIYVSFEDVVAFVQRKLSWNPFATFQFEKFLAFMKWEFSRKSSCDNRPSGLKRLCVS